MTKLNPWALSAFLFLLNLSAFCQVNDDTNYLNKEQLVTIKLKGTSIDILPDGIDIIATDLYKTAKKFTTYNNIFVDTLSIKKLKKGSFISFSDRNILYFFTTAESWVDWIHFKNEDVLYTFNLENVSEIENFTSKYQLKKVKTIEPKNTNDIIHLYESIPNYYVILIIHKSLYQCAMHPETTAKSAGSCPICGMDLIPIDSH